MTVTASYCTSDDVWNLTGYNSEQVDTVKLSYYIYRATIAVIRDITIRRENALLLAGPNNSEWYTQNYPLADINGDKLVNTSDVQVYMWADIGDENTKSGVTVSYVNYRTGRILLASDPGSNIVTIDYSFYPSKIDWDIIRDATAYLAGFKYAVKEWALVPEWMKLGGLSIKQNTKQYVNLYKEYKRCINQVITKRWKKGEQHIVTEPDRSRTEDLVSPMDEEISFPMS